MPAGYCGSVAAIWDWMPEACPATCAPLCAGTHGAKLVPSAPYEPAHQAPMGAGCAKAITGMTSATAANATIPVHLMSLSVGLDSLQSTPPYPRSACFDICEPIRKMQRGCQARRCARAPIRCGLRGQIGYAHEAAEAATAEKCHRSVPVG